jgi:BCD family chlorophyll transporter-like MFS transporter
MSATKADNTASAAHRDAQTGQSNRPFGWGSIIRLGLIQACLGAVVVLATSTLNRVMVVELALPALLPGFLVAMHYVVQLLRPRMGYGSDRSGRCTPWILGGMTVLASGGVLGAYSVTQMDQSLTTGIALAVAAFLMIGAGVSASGTSVLVLLAKRVPEQRRAAAATIVWLMMIAGFAVTAGIAGKLLDPYSEARLITVAASVAAIAVTLTALMLIRLEGSGGGPAADPQQGPRDFILTLREVWREPAARQFTVFVFVSMLAFSAQDLILEPFAGTVFGYTPGQSTQLSGLQHAGILVGMLLVALAGSARIFGRAFGSLRFWTISGCIASAIALAGLVAAGLIGPGWPLAANVMLLGAANGAFSIAAIASMMRLAGEGQARREGTRMGLWGAAQALAFGFGGLLGTALSDLARLVVSEAALAYAIVFGLESILFIVSARLAADIRERSPDPHADYRTHPIEPIAQETAHA